MGKLLNLNKLWPILACIPPLLVLVFIVCHKPHLGLMDDWQHLFVLLPQIKELGVIGATLEYVRTDLQLGVVRYTYPPMVWLVYGLGGADHPMLTFIINWIFVVFVTGYTAFLLARILLVPFWFLFVAPFAAYYFHDLFLFPSLQEKLLLIFGISLIYLCSNACKLSWGKKAPLLILAAVLGGVTKTNFVIFFLPATILLFWNWWIEKKSKWLSFVAPLFLFVLVTLVLAYFASRGSYNGGRYSLQKAINNLFSFQFFYLTMPLLVSVLWIKSAWKKVGINYFIPAFCLIGFYCVFLPWGIDAYIQTVVVSFVAASMVQAIFFSPVGDSWKKLAFLALVAAAVVVTGFRSNRNFQRMADLGESLRFLSTKTGIPIYADCPEGHIAMESYLRHEGSPNITVNYWFHVKKRADHFLFVGDAALCPLVEKIEGCSSKILQEGQFSKSFKVVEWNCDRS